MKKVLAAIVTIAMMCLLFGCAKTADQKSTTAASSATSATSAQIANPVHESTADEILNKLGINLNIPADAQNVKYSIIDTGDSYSVGQAQFTKNNIDYTYRVKSATALEDISGAYYDWTTKKDIKVSYCSGQVQYIAGKEGICLWYDTVPGLMYSIYADSGASEESLLALANELYVPEKDAQ